MTTPLAPPNIDRNEEPTLIFHPSILLSVRLTSSTCPKKSPSDVKTCFPTISDIFFIFNILVFENRSIYILCFLESYVFWSFDKIIITFFVRFFETSRFVFEQPPTLVRG